MARRKYVKGALVEARNSKYGKGFGIILSDREMRYTNAHGYYRKFGLARNKLREAAMRGDIPLSHIHI